MIPTRLMASGSVVLTDDLKAFIEEKVEKLEKVLDPNDTSVKADIEVGTTGGARTGEQFRAEINLSFAGGFVRAEATTESLRTSIDEALDEARRELKTARTKKRGLVRRSAARMKDFLRFWSGGK